MFNYQIKYSVWHLSVPNGKCMSINLIIMEIKNANKNGLETFYMRDLLNNCDCS